MEEGQDDQDDYDGPDSPEIEGTNDEEAPTEETTEEGEGPNNEVANIAAKFLNRQRGWQGRVDAASKRNDTCPPPRRTQPVRATKAVKTVPKGVVKTRANPLPTATNAAGDEAISRILKLVKKGNLRGVRVERSVSRMEMKIADIDDTIAGILTALARKYLVFYTTCEIQILNSVGYFWDYPQSLVNVNV